MQYWNNGRRAFVDIMDGYAHLPFIDDRILSIRSLDDKSLSTLLHEFSHHHAVQGVIGAFVAHLTALHAGSQLIAQAEYEGLSQPGTDELVDNLWAREFYFNSNHFADPIFLYSALTYSLAWLFEGLATLIELRLTGFEKPPATSHLAFVHVFFNTFSETQSVSTEQIQEKISRARAANIQRGLKLEICMSPSTTACPYFAGYLMVSQLQRTLATKDRRLQDPALLFEFMTNYFFNDPALLRLQRVQDGSDWPSYKVVSKHIIVAVSDLCSAPRPQLSAAVDTLLADLRTAARPARSLRQLIAGTEEQLTESLINNQLSFLRENWFGQRVSEILNKEGVTRHSGKPGVEILKKATAVAEGVYDSLCRAQGIFRLRQSDPLLLGYHESAMSARGLGYILLGYPGIPAHVARIIPREDIRMILSKEALNSDVVNLAERRADVVDLKNRRINIAEADALLRKAASGRAFRLHEIDAYDVISRERLTIFRNGELTLVRNGRTKRGKPLSATRQKELENLGPALWREHYWPLIGITTFQDYDPVAPAWPQIEAVLCQVWRVIFPETQADDHSLARFFREKIRVLQLSTSTSDFLKSALLESEITAANSSDESNHVTEINNKSRPLFGDGSNSNLWTLLR